MGGMESEVQGDDREGPSDDSIAQAPLVGFLGFDVYNFDVYNLVAPAPSHLV